MRGMRSRRGYGMVIGIVTAAGCLAAALTGVLGLGAAAGAVSTDAVRAIPAAGNPTGNVDVPAAGRAVDTRHPTRVIGHGTPASCTSAAVVKAVAAGGIITFNCGPKPVTITMTAAAKVVNTSHEVVLDGGGKVTLNGAGKTRILYMNTCDPKQKYTTSDCWEQQWPLLVVQNLTFKNAYSAVRQTATSNYGGGAIFDEGGQLKVVNSIFTGDRCYASGPDLGGGAVRAVGMYMGAVVYITHDTFSGNSCSNGAALSGLYARFGVFNSLFTNNRHATRRQRRRHQPRRQSPQPDHRGDGDDRQQRARGRRRDLLRRERGRRPAQDQVLQAHQEPERRVPERSRHLRQRGRRRHPAGRGPLDDQLAAGTRHWQPAPATSLR